MKKETYAFEIRTLVAQFVDAFNDIVIRRYDNDETIEDKIHVNFLYSPKTRTLNDIVNKAQHIKLPIVSVSLGGISRNSGRVFNKLVGPMYNKEFYDTGYTSPLQPVPIDITMNMSIITRFQSDMDQILTNFMPYTDPYIVISWPAPYNSDLELRNVVKWSGNVSMQYPTEVSHQQQYRCIADTAFTIEGWVFKVPSDPVGKIYNIDTSFTAISDINARYEQMLEYETTDNTDEIYIRGRPQLKHIAPYITIPCVSGTSFTLEGSMFTHISGLYVTATNSVYNFAPSGTPLSAIDGNYISYYYPHRDNYRVSAQYPGFSGVMVTDWTINSDSRLTFTLPKPVSAGYIDVIAYNEAGYGVLKQDCIRPTLNPYPSGSAEYNNYVEYQPPEISGIQVAPFYYNC